MRRSLACVALAFGVALVSSDTVSALSLPKGALLKRVEAGAVVASEAPVPAGDLWKDNGAVVLVVRRSG